MYSFYEQPLLSSLQPGPTGDNINSQVLLANPSGIVGWTNLTQNDLDDAEFYFGVENFPVSGQVDKIYVDKTNKNLYIWDGYSYQFLNDIQNYWGAVPTTKGGTGLISYTKGQIVYSDNTDSLAKLNIGSNNAVLTSNSLVPVWKNTLDVSNGCNGITSYTAGDLIYASGTSTLSKLGIGANNFVLTSNGTAPTWAANQGIVIGSSNTVGGGIRNTELVQTTTGTSDSNIFTIRGNKAVQLSLISDNDNVGEAFTDSPMIYLTQDGQVSQARIYLAGTDMPSGITTSIPNFNNNLCIHTTSSTEPGVFVGANGTLTTAFKGTLTQTTVPIIYPDGASATPSISFTTNTGVGLFYQPTNTSVGVCGGLDMNGFPIYMSGGAKMVVPTGSNACQGEATLVPGGSYSSVVIYTNKILATSYVYLSYYGLNTNNSLPTGTLTYLNINSTTSFEVRSTTTTNDCKIRWLIIGTV
jgi:hypothetical protein